jgi:hypothetical protein
MEMPMNTDTATRSDLDALTTLNRDYIHSVQHGDVRRFDEILAVDFLCSNPDGSLVDKNQFLEQTARPVTISGLSVHEVRVRILGDIAIIHARTSYTTADGEQRNGRYTRCLGASGRKVARGIGACDAIKMFPAGSANDWRCAVGERIMVYSAATGTPPCSARHHLEQEITQ